MDPSCSFKTSVIVGLFSVPVSICLNSPSVNGPVVERSVPNNPRDDSFRGGGIIDSISVFENIDFVGVVDAILEFLRKRIGESFCIFCDRVVVCQGGDSNSVEEWSDEVEDGFLCIVISALVELRHWSHLVLVEDTLKSFKVVLPFGSLGEGFHDKEIIFVDLHQLELGLQSVVQIVSKIVAALVVLPGRPLIVSSLEPSLHFQEMKSHIENQLFL